MKAEAKRGAELWERINALIASKPGEPIKESFIASKAGLTKNMYSVYKNRQSLLRSDTLYGIAQALSTSVEFLLTGREPGRITFDEAAFLSVAKPYRPVIQGLDALDAHARAVLSRAIIDLASPPAGSGDRSERRNFRAEGAIYDNVDSGEGSAESSATHE